MLVIDNVPEDISGAGYSFVSDISLRPVLAPASLLVIAWLALVAFYSTPEHPHGAAQRRDFRHPTG